MRHKETPQQMKADAERYRWLCDWLLENGIQEHTGETYKELRAWLLRSGIVEYIKVTKSESEPFVMDTYFYGETFEAAVDAARLVAKRKAF